MPQDVFLDQIIARYAPTATDKSFSSERWPIMQAAADQVIALLGAQPPARILDLACGCGASTTALALRGFDVTGLDCTPQSIDIARRMSAEKAATVTWLCQDMRQIDYQAQFDHVCLRDVIFGIFETDHEHVDLLRRIARALKPAGRCLLEVYNKEFSLTHGVENFLRYDPALDRFTAPPQFPIGMKLYSLDQWRTMLEDQGLTITKTHGWKWPKDPDPPPWRADFIVAQMR